MAKIKIWKASTFKVSPSLLGEFVVDGKEKLEIDEEVDIDVVKEFDVVDSAVELAVGVTAMYLQDWSWGISTKPLNSEFPCIRAFNACCE